MTRFWSIAAVALLLTALPLGAADTSKMLADASAKASMLAFVTYTVDNDPPQTAGGQAICIDAAQGIFMTYSVEGWMKTKSIKNTEKDFPKLLLSDGKSVKAQLLWVDPEVGLGFFKALEKGNYTAANFNKAAAPAVGAQVSSVGLLDDANHTPYVASAYVSATLKNPDNTFVLVTGGHLTSDCSPVFNEAGEVIGIVVPQQFEQYTVANQQGQPQNIMLKHRQNSSVFLPISNLANVLDYVVKTPDKPRALPWIGVIAMGPANEEIEKKVGKPCIVIPKEGVVPNQAGDKAGLKGEDVILAVNGKAVEKPAQVQMMVSKFQRELIALGIGSDVTLTVRHKDDYTKDVAVKIHLDAVPTQPQEAARYVSQPLGFIARDIVLIDHYSQQTPAVVKGAKGVLVMMVGKDTAAYDNGLTPGSVITMVNDVKIDDIAGFKAEVEKALTGSPDKDVKLSVRSGIDDVPQTINIKPARPTTQPGGAGPK